MMPKMNPRQMEKMMKQMGIQSQNIEADEVIIRCADKEIIITNPSIQRRNNRTQHRRRHPEIHRRRHPDGNGPDKLRKKRSRRRAQRNRRRPRRSHTNSNKRIITQPYTGQLPSQPPKNHTSPYNLTPKASQPKAA